MPNYRTIMKLLAAVAVVLLSTPALAVPVRDARGDVYFTEPTPSRLFVLSQSSLTIPVAADACGRVLVRNSVSTRIFPDSPVYLDSQLIGAASTLPTDTLSRCINGVPEVTHPTNFRLPDGSIVIVGLAPFSRHQFFNGTRKTRAVTANGCGFIRIQNPPSNFAVTTDAKGTIPFNEYDEVEVRGLPIVNPPRCINNVLYTPAP